ncbi:MAG: CocE/NonD family hydrolase [Cyanobacteriota bacterium]|nr:CocE/NonD family hydrolase [Cyanobacteriota bacterium]
MVHLREAWMGCGDGIRLASRIWTPPGEGPWPVLLMRQPYGSALASTVTYAHPHWYAEQGFLVVVQDVRGRGDSEGTFGGFAQEARDGAEAVRWARQLPHGNGRLGTYGFSYQGLSQLLNAGGGEEPDPLPDCLAPAMCGLDERLDWASEGGAHWWALGLGWALQLAAQGAQRRGDGQAWAVIRRSLETGDFLHNGLSLLEEHDPGGMGLGWLRADPLTPQPWVQHQPAATLLRRPMLLIGGWHDPHLRGVLRLWEWATSCGGRPSLHVGAWSHLHWHGGMDQEQVDFFRRHLGGHPGPGAAGRSTEPGAIWLQDVTTGRWFTTTPGASTARARWCLTSDGRAAIRSDGGCLGEHPPGSNQTVVVVHDPWRPVPGRGGHLGGEALLADRTDLDQRTDVACFTTAPLVQTLQLVGRPVLRLRVRADQPGFDLCAALSVVGGDDRRARQLCTGLLRVLGQEAMAPLERRVEFQPLAATLQAGEQLRLSLAPAAWPHVAVNGGDGRQPQSGPTALHRIITLTLLLAGADLAILPLLPGMTDGGEATRAAN